MRICDFVWVLKISAIQSDCRALPRADSGAPMSWHFQSLSLRSNAILDTNSKMAFYSAATSMLRYRLSTGLENQLEFPWNFYSFYQNLYSPLVARLRVTQSSQGQPEFTGQPCAHWIDPWTLTDPWPMTDPANSVWSATTGIYFSLYYLCYPRN